MSERWTDERLDRFADSVDRSIVDASKERQELRRVITNAAEERQELREVFLSTMQVVSESAQAQAEMLKSITEMQAEVRGLQVENRRIMDHLFGSEP